MARQLRSRRWVIVAPVVLALLASAAHGRAQAQSDQTRPQAADSRFAALQTQWNAADTPARLRILKRLQLRRVRTAAAVPLLVTALQDRDPKIRSGAAIMFRWIGPAAKPAVPALLAALQDSDRTVRHAAAWG